MSNPDPPTIYIIAGPNGAGKTTFATEFLPDFVRCREFLNADLIAAGLSPFAPETQDFRASRLMLTRINELVAERQSFGVETTLAGRGYARLLQKMKATGYKIVLLFLWLPSVDMAIFRVRARVRQGGHDIPEPVIVRRFQAGLRNLFNLYRGMADIWRVYDASRLPPRVIVHEEAGRLMILDEEKFEGILRDSGR